MARLRDAVEWIALNDAAGDTEGLTFSEAVAEVAGLISVLLVADLWDKDPRVLARQIVRIRKQEGWL